MMHVACGANVGYLPYAAAMLHSLLTHHRDAAVTIHFMHDDAMPATEMAKLADMVHGFGAQWRAHCIDGTRLQGYPVSWRFGKEAWYRTLLPELLPELDRVLYLDADTLVLRPLDALWRTELGGRIAAAIHNPMYPFLDPAFMLALGLESPKAYFNSGVLLLDLNRWRAAGISQQLREFLKAHGTTQNWPDQNALNAVLKGDRCLLLDPIWNAQNVFFDLSPEQLSMDRGQVREIRERPAIVHFIAPYKPLDYLCKHVFRPAFFTHLEATPWADAPIRGRTPGNRLLRLLPQPFMWELTMVTLPRAWRRLRRTLRLAR